MGEAILVADLSLGDGPRLRSSSSSAQAFQYVSSRGVRPMNISSLVDQKSLGEMLERWAAEHNKELETDPVTLSEGVVLQRLGPSKDKWGREVELVDVRVLQPKEHHKRGDRVIWEIPTEEELQKVSQSGRILTRVDRLRLWNTNPGSGPDRNSTISRRLEE